MHRNSIRLLAGALVAATLVVAAWIWSDAGAGPNVPETTSTRAPAQVAIRAAPRALPAPPAMPAIALARDPGIPLADHVDRLLATLAPQDAYTAYLLVSQCANFNRRHELEIHDDKVGAKRGLNPEERRHMTALCGQMTERERLARLDYLTTAVKAGVPGAVLAYVAEGPFGDPSALTTRPDDPLVREWKAGAAEQLTRAAEAGDQATLTVWGIQTLYGSDLGPKDPVQGYAYLLASVILEAERLGPSTLSAQAHADGSPLLSALAGELTQQQRAVAIAAGRQLADRVKARRRREQA